MPDAAPLLQRVRPADVLDVLVVSVSLYVAFSWLKRARTRFLLGGLALIVGLYFVALRLDMRVTLRLYQAILTVAAVALVVVFQEDIRRGFERLASGTWSRARASTDPIREAARVIVEAADRLASRRMGALVVVRGKDPIDRHLEGGVTLDATLSVPLLESIFDPHTAGHDGAVIVEAGRAARFGVHLLPPCTAPPETRPSGTRHAAALGLAERCDALVVVVSEERGVISVAQNRALTEVKRAELGRCLDAFLDVRAPEVRPGRFARRALAQNLGLKLLSFALAAGAWAAVLSEETEVIVETVEVPVRVRSAPPRFWIEQPEPRRITLRLRGPKHALATLDPEALAVHLDAGGARAGTQVLTVAEDEVSVPPGVTLLGIEPREVTITAIKTTAIKVPVRPDTRGSLPRGIYLIRAFAQPDKVTIVVPSARVGQIAPASTDAIELSGIRESSRIRTKLRLPEGARLDEHTSPEVDVVIEVGGARPTAPASAGPRP